MTGILCRALLALALVVAPALAAPPFKRGGQPATGGGGCSPMTLTLNFVDGSTQTFNQTAATDIGDYVGPFVQQKNYRQIAAADGTWHGAFLVDFRPDTDCGHSEAVVEFGTRYDFTGNPVEANGVAPTTLFSPEAPVPSKTTGSPATQSGTAYFVVSYVFPGGEGVPSFYSNPGVVLASGDRATVPSPPAVNNATGYHVYGNLNSIGTFYKQTTSPTPIGTTWSAPDGGIALSGTQALTAPTVNAYTATVSGGAFASPVTVDVPIHTWNTRFRISSGPRPFVRTPADIIAMKAIMPLSASLKYGYPDASALATWGGPMSLGGLRYSMGDAGDHPTIGPWTEAFAQWVAGVAGREESVRANAEGTGTMHIWVRDAATGALVNAVTHPYLAHQFTATADKKIPFGVNNTSIVNRIRVETGHMPNASFHAWLATDDPYFLEGAQAIANYGTISANNTPLAEGLPQMVDANQPRGLAWSTRNYFQLATWGPVSTPSWLLQRSYFVSGMGDLKTYAMRFVNASVSPLTTVFKFIPNTDWMPAAFQIDYETIVAAQIKSTGAWSDWDAIVDYMITPRMNTTDPANEYAGGAVTGWDPRFSNFWYMPAINARLGAAITGYPAHTKYNVANSADTPTSWSEFFTNANDFWLNSSFGNSLIPTYTDYSTWTTGQLTNFPNLNGYFYEVRASLAALTHAGIAGASARHDWLKPKIDAQYPSGGAAAGYKWAIVPAP